MFDLITGGVPHPLTHRSIGPTAVSVIAHIVIVTAVVIIPIMYVSGTLPQVPTMMAFVAAAPAPPPPPPPPPAPAPAGRPAQAKPPDTPSTGKMAAPIDAPAEIRPEPPGPATQGPGVVGGVEGGIEGGVVGGIVGGLVAAPPPPPPPPPPPEPPKRAEMVHIGGQISAPALITRVEPVYPPVAVFGKVGGVVILEAQVGEDGCVRAVNVLRSIPLLDAAAVEAVKQWRYKPLVLNGTPTSFILTVTLTFRAPA